MYIFLTKLLRRALIIIALANISILAITSPARASAIAHISSFADIVEPLMPSVVNIYTVRYNQQINSKDSVLPEMLPMDKFNNFFEQFNVPFSFEDLYNMPSAIALGSGFIIDAEGHILTNDHVVTGSDEIYVKLSDNTEVPAKIIGNDPKTDIALLKINVDRELPAVKFADSNRVRVGDVVIAIGNPLGFGGTVTSGIISSKGRDLGINQDELVDDFLQTDAAINTGNSGGPLYDINGKVIGVNTSVPDINGGTNIGIGFAIPSNTVVDIMNQLKEKGRVNRGRLNIGVQEITQELAEALSLKEVRGVLVVNVKAGGTGEKAGLQRGDLIKKFNGQDVLNSRKLQLLVGDSHVGEEIKLSIIRNNEPMELTTKIMENTMPKEALQPAASKVARYSGIGFSDISPSLRKQFGISESDGILVVTVSPERAGTDIRVGDVVSSINQQPIANIEQFGKIYQELSNTGKQNAILLIKRGDFSMFSALPLK